MNWTIQISNGSEHLDLMGIKMESRPTLHIEEDVIKEGEVTMYRAKRGEDGKIISHWLPLVISNVSADPEFPSGGLCAIMKQYDESGKMREKWVLDHVSPRYEDGKIYMSYDVASYFHGDDQ